MNVDFVLTYYYYYLTLYIAHVFIKHFEDLRCSTHLSVIIFIRQSQCYKICCGSSDINMRNKYHIEFNLVHKNTNSRFSSPHKLFSVVALILTVRGCLYLLGTQFQHTLFSTKQTLDLSQINTKP